ncbi:glycerol-3-phosphate dehydrogenase [Hydrogenispora ethanolica]|uniref:Glycerol-3-phosphate dehydrogenase n=1 Tax=Hydrogenispora ethanolica TaxID=1082276 RepID=A0A4R1RZU4_HYDET|nr:NAD(P)/FAD-dependent oxidoreductase [Hydrogenispora ethanolica]TCL72331.1 glycerol-3-phosphate dehydrogenase [Hydrogenispora ethanolica]
MLQSQCDVLIIGAGVVGAAVARQLSRFELRVILIEREADIACGTSKANSGIVHSGIHDHPGTLKARLCVRGNQLYPALAAELDFLYRQNGSLVVARQPEELPLLDELVAQGRQNGVPGVAPLTPAELLQLEPNLAPDLAGGLLVPSGGIVVPFDLVFALIENAVANGLELRLNTEVTGIRREDDGFLVETTGGAFRAAYVVNAAGLGSAAIARMVGDESFAIHPVKGEEYLLDRRLEGLVRRTVFPLPTPLSKGILVIPTVDGNIMLGPTAHPVADNHDRETTAAGWAEIFREVRTLVPSLNPSDLITAFAGLRAASAQEDFIIERSRIAPRLIHLAGINSPGLTAAPAIAEYVEQLLEEGGLRLTTRFDFQPRRPLVRMRELSRERQAELIRENPQYANIVCRCEMVSEAEIRAAIRRGATTVDGIKLRTRSGMGRCQGGFCTPKVLRILAEELGCPPEAITKKGPGSQLLTGPLRSFGSHDGTQ